MKNIFLLFLLFFTIPVFALGVDRCIMENNISCQNCVTTEIKIIGTQGGETIFIGDTFYYEIELRSIGNETLNTSFLVSVYSPENRTLKIRVYKNQFVPIQNAIYLKPMQTDKIYDIYPIDLLGSYKVELRSKNIMFYKFYDDCSYIQYSDVYTFYFDAMPQWQYKSNQRLEEWQNSNIELMKESTILGNETRNLIIETNNLNKKIEGLTYALFFLAFVTVVIKLTKHSKKHMRLLLSIEAIFLTIILGSFSYLMNDFFSLILIIIFLGLPNILLHAMKILQVHRLKIFGYRLFNLLKVVQSFILYMMNPALFVYSMTLFSSNELLSTIMMVGTFVMSILSFYNLTYASEKDDKKRISFAS